MRSMLQRHLPAGGLAMALLITLLLGCGGTEVGNPDTVQSDTTASSAPQLSVFQSATEAETYLVDQYATTLVNEQAYVSANTDIDLDAESIEGYSQTRISDSDAGDADLMVIDEDIIYMARNQKVTLVQATSPVTDLSTIDIGGTVNSLYLKDHTLIALYTPGDDFGAQWQDYDLPFQWTGFNFMGEVLAGLPFWIPVSARAGVALIDVTDPYAPQVIRQWEMDGDIVTARLTQTGFQLILQFMPDLPVLRLWYDGSAADWQDAVDANQQALAHIQLEDLLPQIEERSPRSRAPEKTFLVSPMNIYHPADGGGGTLITILTLDLSSPEPTFVTTGMALDTQAACLSGEKLYLAAEKLNRDPFADAADSPQTLIYAFTLDSSGARPAASGQVAGQLLNQSAMGAYEGVLRIATRIESSNEPSTFPEVRIYCLKSLEGDLAIAGHLENPVQDSLVYSIRFDRDLGYVVPYINLDPVLLLDLSDPTQPTSAGYLSVSGYADVLKRYGESHLMVLGKAAMHENGTWYQGLQLSLFDISDSFRPVLVGQDLIGDRGTDSEALENPKALCLAPDTGYMAFPVDLYEKSGGDRAPFGTGEHTFSGLYIYQVSQTGGFEYAGRISLVDVLRRSTGLAGAADQRAWWDWFEIDWNRWTRASFMGNTVYAVTPDQVGRADLNDIDGSLETLTFASNERG